MQGLDLDRITDHGKIAGVCAGVAERWRIDPLLVRIGAVLLALCSGIGAVLYGAAWLLLPAKGDAEAPLMAKFPKAKQVPTVWWYVIVGALCLVAMGTLGQLMPISTGPVIAIAVLWYFGIYRPSKRRAANARDTGNARGAGPVRTGTGDPTAGSPGTPGSYGTSGASHHSATSFAPYDPNFTPYDPNPRFGTGIEPEGYPDQWPVSGQPTSLGAQQSTTQQATTQQATTQQARTQPRHDDRTTGRTSTTRTATDRDGRAARWVRTIAIATIIAAVIPLAVFHAMGVWDVPLLGYAATALLIVGVALVVSAWTGRARGLLPLGCLMLALTVIGIGTFADESHTPGFSVTASYSTVDEIPGPQSIDVGEVRADMSELDLTRDATYAMTVDSGTIVVFVPRDTNVVINARVDVGSIEALDQHRQGVDLVERSTSRPNPGGPVLTLDLAVDVGSITVVR